MKDYYNIKAVSNSSLSWFQKSPKFFKMMLDKEIGELTPSYFEKGQQIHMYLLEPDEFDLEYVFLDYDTPKSKQQKDFCESYARSRKGTKEEKLIKSYKKAYTTKENDEKVLEKAVKLSDDYRDYIKYIKQSQVKKVLPHNMLLKLNDIRSAVLSHKKAKELMYNEHNSTFGNDDKLFIMNELPVLWEYPKPYDVPCKSMLDRIIIDHEKKEITMVDLKTTSHLSEFKDKALEYRYNRQLAFYWMAIHWYFKYELKMDIGEYKKYSYIVAVSTVEPTEVKVFKVSDQKLLDGMLEIERIMPEVKYHFENDKWEYPMSYYEGEGIEIL